MAGQIEYCDNEACVWNAEGGKCTHEYVSIVDGYCESEEKIEGEDDEQQQ